MTAPSLLRRALLAAAAALALGSVPALAGAVITIVNADGAGEGFNDTAPATPVGGNTGTTVGQQRLMAFEYAAGIWAALLDSPVEIRVRASFDPMPCTADSAQLGATHPGTVASASSGAPLPDTWYPAALANRLSGMDVSPDSDDIIATFNSSIGQAGCFEGSGWYYGLDAAHGDRVDLVAVLLHELAHGLGFETLVDETTGAEFQGQPDVFESMILDTSTYRHWTDMSDAERVASAVNTGHLTWDGPAVWSAAPGILDGVSVLTVLEPPAIAANLPVGAAAFGAPLSDEGVTADLAAALDASNVSGPAATDACSPLTNAAEVAGRVALVDRGTCPFVVKASNVQAAGAVAMVVVDNVTNSTPPGLGGSEPTITIPCASLTRTDGEALRASLGSGRVAVRLRTNPRQRAGTGAGARMLLYAPDPDEPGSSVSHWDTSAVPNLLMEPNLSGDLPHTVDLTLPLLRDIGWSSDEFLPPELRRPVVRVETTPQTRAAAPRP
jgi:hypothetical protein